MCFLVIIPMDEALTCNNYKIGTHDVFGNMHDSHAVIANNVNYQVIVLSGPQMR